MIIEIIKKVGLLKNFILYLGIIFIIIFIVIIIKYPFLPTEIQILNSKVNISAMIGLWSTLTKTIIISILSSSMGSLWWKTLLNNKMSAIKADANSNALNINGLFNIHKMYPPFIIIVFINLINLLTSFWTQQGYYITNQKYTNYENLSVPTLSMNNDKFFTTAGPIGDISSYDNILITTGINLLNGEQPITYGQVASICKGNCTIPLNNFYGVNITCNQYFSNNVKGVDRSTVYNANIIQDNNSNINYPTKNAEIIIKWLINDGQLKNNKTQITCKIFPSTYYGELYIYDNGNININYNWISNDDVKIYDNRDIQNINRYLPMAFWYDVLKGTITTNALAGGVFYSNPLLKYGIGSCNEMGCKSVNLPDNLIKGASLYLLSYGFYKGSSNITNLSEVTIHYTALKWNYNWIISIIIYYFLLLIISWIVLLNNIISIDHYRDLSFPYIISAMDIKINIKLYDFRSKSKDIILKKLDNIIYK